MIMEIPFIPFLTFIAIIFLILKKRTKSRNVPPGPNKIPIIGNLHQLGKLPHRSLQKLSASYGDLMLLQLGFVPTLVVSSADRARDIFKHHDLAFSDRPELYVLKKICYNLSCVSSAPYGDYWREARRILVLELMTARRVDSFRSTRVEEIDRMIDRIASTGAEPVDLSSAVFAFSNHVVSRAVLGVTEDVDSGSFQKIFKELQHLVAEFNVADFFPGLGWINRINGVDRRIDDYFRDLDSFFQKLFEDHRSKTESESDSEKEDFIDVLLRVQTDSGLSDQHLKGVLLDVFVGGSDTSATTIVWIMSELMRNPTVRRKAEQQVREIAKGKSRVEESDLPKLRYLKQVIKESFRLHPPAPLLVPRKTTQPCIIAHKFEIPANTRVFFNVVAMSADPAVWENPDEFRPERFEDSRVDFKGKHFELLPFGAGRRGCPGIAFAVAVVELAVANLLFCFDWKLPEGVEVDLEEEIGIVMHKKTPLYWVATPVDGWAGDM